MNKQSQWLFEAPLTPTANHYPCANSEYFNTEWETEWELQEASPYVLSKEEWEQSLASSPHGQTIRETISGFSRHSNAIPHQERAKIVRIAQLIVQSYRSGQPIRTVRLVGHADRDVKRGASFEKKISGDRALEVKKQLINSIRSPTIASRVSWQIKALGSTQLVVPNPKTENDRRRNRRVDIIFSPTLSCLKPSDVIDARIDADAQKALLRMCKREPAERTDATGILAAVKEVQLAGIHGDKARVNFTLLQKLKTTTGKLIPQGEDAALVFDPTDLSKPPTIVFREQVRALPHRLDPALRKAWSTFLLTKGRLKQCPSPKTSDLIAGRVSTISSGLRIGNIVPTIFCSPDTPDWFSEIVPIILVPGIMGTRLIDPKTSQLIFNPTGVFLSPDTRKSRIGGRGFGRFAANVSRLQDMSLPLMPATDSNIPNTDKFKVYKSKADRVKNFGNLVPDFYDELAFTLSSDSFAQQIGKRVRVYACGYDWRQDNALSVSRLDSVVDQALQETGAKKAIIIAHSMGGLVSRYYCHIGAPGKAKGEDKVRSLILLGSPTHGSPKAYRTLKTGITYSDDLEIRTLFFDLVTDAQKISFLRTFPSIYQLLPTNFYCDQNRDWLTFDPKKTGIPPFIPASISDASDPVKLYDNHHTGFIEANSSNVIVAKNLSTRQSFDQNLGKSMPDPQKVTTHVIYSSGVALDQLQFKFLPTESKYRLRDHPNGTFDLDNISGSSSTGDGTVPVFSGRADGCIVSGERIDMGLVKHDKLPNSLNVQNEVKRLVQKLVSTP
jgi:outer membrane protein OmpA-like peptidoglycan-associated protein/pimeloyl-ACP methyl ester carboxylesterase